MFPRIVIVSKLEKKVSENSASKSVPFIPLSSFRSHCITAVCHSLVSGALDWNQMIFKVPSNPYHSMILFKVGMLD